MDTAAKWTQYVVCVHTEIKIKINGWCLAQDGWRAKQHKEPINWVDSLRTQQRETDKKAHVLFISSVKGRGEEHKVNKFVGIPVFPDPGSLKLWILMTLAEWVFFFLIRSPWRTWTLRRWTGVSSHLHLLHCFQYCPTRSLLETHCVTLQLPWPDFPFLPFYLLYSFFNLNFILFYWGGCREREQIQGDRRWVGSKCIMWKTQNINKKET